MSTIYILIPHSVRTGGPEALHQLSDSLLRQGQTNTFVVYYHDNQIESLRAMARERRAAFPGLRFAMGDSNVPEYAAYLKQICEEVPNEPGTIVVLPEVLADISPQFDRSQVVLWWLSVDNAFGSLARINLNHLRRKGIWHATQSAYARRFIESLGFRHAGNLTDYTSDLFGTVTVMAERPMRIALNAGHKVVIDLDALSTRLQAAIPGLDIRRIVGLSREQVLETLQTSRVFIDLGSFPGKDRLAREAARLGCAIVVADVGAGATAEDYDTDEADRIDPWQLDRVVERVRQLALRPAVAQENNRRLLAQVSTERDGFDDEVKALMTMIHSQLGEHIGSPPSTDAADLSSAAPEFAASAHRQQLRQQSESLATQLIAEWTRIPSIQLLMGFSAGQEALLAETLDSLGQQLYTRWTMIIASDQPAPAGVSALPQIQWLWLKDIAYIQGVLELMARHSDADWLAIARPGQIFARQALLTVADLSNRNPGLRLIGSSAKSRLVVGTPAAPLQLWETIGCNFSAIEKQALLGCLAHQDAATLGWLQRLQALFSPQAAILIDAPEAGPAAA